MAYDSREARNTRRGRFQLRQHRRANLPKSQSVCKQPPARMTTRRSAHYPPGKVGWKLAWSDKGSWELKPVYCDYSHGRAGVFSWLDLYWWRCSTLSYRRGGMSKLNGSIEW